MSKVEGRGLNVEGEGEKSSVDKKCRELRKNVEGNNYIENLRRKVRKLTDRNLVRL